MNMLKRMVPAALKRHIKRAMGFKTMADRLLNLRQAGFVCTGAVDVGAFHGEWAGELRAVWPVPVLLVEPQPQCAEILQKFLQAQQLPGSLYAACALGKAAGAAAFQLQQTGSRLLAPNEAESLPTIQVPVATLSSLLEQHRQSFNLLKVDVQGFELDVLAGADTRLQQFEVIILEVSLLRILPAPLFLEVMQYMHERGYRLYDFLPMYYRPLDKALWQGDAFFVRNDSALVSSCDWE